MSKLRAIMKVGTIRRVSACISEMKIVEESVPDDKLEQSRQNVKLKDSLKKSVVEFRFG